MISILCTCWPSGPGRQALLHPGSGRGAPFPGRCQDEQKKELAEGKRKKSEWYIRLWPMKSEAKIREVIGSEVRVAVPGHMQRGGEPYSYDRDAGHQAERCGSQTGART